MNLHQVSFLNKNLLLSFFIYGLGILLPSLLLAQSPSRSSVTFEVGGAALGYALGWEQVIWQGPDLKWSARAGVGLLPLRLYLPFASELVFLPGSHHMVVGVSASGSLETNDRFQFDRLSSDTFLTLGGILGYRWQPESSRWFIQTTINPGLRLDPTPSQLSSTDPVGRFGIGLMLGYGLF
ncbi:MAG: hypothetical protein AAF804_05675 [Bacteroidota bacterium]